MRGDLEEEVDIELLERLDHGAAEEALVQTDRDRLDVEATEPADELVEPRFCTGRRVIVAGPPENPRTLTGLLGEGEQRVMRRQAGLVKVVPSLGPGLLLPVADGDGGVEQQDNGLGDPDVLLPPDHNLAEQLSQQRGARSPGPLEPATECRGIGDLAAAEDAPGLPRLQKDQIIKPAASVQQQRDPSLHQQRGAVVPPIPEQRWPIHRPR